MLPASSQKQVRSKALGARLDFMWAFLDLLCMGLRLEPHTELKFAFLLPVAALILRELWQGVPCRQVASEGFLSHEMTGVVGLWSLLSRLPSQE